MFPSWDTGSMKVLVAGAAGVLGRRLVPLLVKAGHQVTGTTRSAERAERLSRLGASPVILDALDRDAVARAVEQAAPEVVIHELTAIPHSLNLRRIDQEFALTNRLRTEGTDILIEAAQHAGCRRFIAQSFAGWTYARTGEWIKSEEDSLMEKARPAMQGILDAIRYLESAVLGQSGMEGFVLRYGWFYGPGTSFGRGGSMIWHVERRRLPRIGRGLGYWSFIHVDDAAAATLAAVETQASPGIYNITDDEPAQVSEWLPYLAESLGAKPPRRVPGWIGRLAIGPHGNAIMNQSRGANNRKAKEQLEWQLRWPTWREGFRHGL